MNDSKFLGDWGKMTSVNESGSVHITQTNSNSQVGEGAHVTTQTPEATIRDYFDSNGNYQETTFSGNK